MMSGRCKKKPCESEALLLSARKGLVPGGLLFDPINEMGEPDVIQDFSDFFDCPLLRGNRVDDGAPKCSGWDIRPLWKEEHLGPGLNLDVALAPWPKPGNRANQRTLASTRFSGNQNSLAVFNHHLGLVDNRGPIVERHREISQAHRCAIAFASWMRPIASPVSARSSASKETISEEMRRAPALHSASRG